MKTIVNSILAVGCCCVVIFALGADGQTPSVAVQAEEPNAKAASVESSWGDLRGRFLYGGEPPQREKLTLNKDIETCSKHQLHSERLIVNEKNRGIANVVLWLETPRRAKLPSIHPSFAKTAEAEVLLLNDKCRFTPHVCVLRTSQTLSIKNGDTVDHNTAAYLNRNLPFNSVTPVGKTDKRKMRKSEREPAKISCSIHSWMTGWLVVQDHPYVAVTDEDGRFKIPNLPVGEWTFRVWHEIPEFIGEAKQGERSIKWTKGRVKITIAPGDNDRGEFVISPTLFK